MTNRVHKKQTCQRQINNVCRYEGTLLFGDRLDHSQEVAAGVSVYADAGVN